MQLQTGEWVLLLSILGMVVFSIWEADKGKVALLEGRKTKVRAYQEAMLLMWLPTLVLLALLMFTWIDSEALGLWWFGTLGQWIGISFACCVIGYFAYSLYALSKNAEQRDAFRKAMGDNHGWMMPSTRKELLWFTLGLSMSAGICEELLFRGFLIGVFSDHIGTVSSLFISSATFGLCHLYQGWKNVARTSFVGLLLGALFIFTELLWVVIVLHAAIDVYGGLVGYILSKTEADKSPQVIRGKAVI